MTSPPDPDGWADHLLPLPRDISISTWVSCAPAAVSVRTRPDAGDVELQAAAELRQLFVDKAGVEPKGDDFEILLGVADLEGSLAGTAVDTRPLRDVPNSEQAYLIRPAGHAKLVLAALDGRGVYYAARTLIQLLEPTLSRDSVSLPLATVIDWPDIEERGLWNFPDVAEWIPWMASLKLNYGKMADTRLAMVERDQPNKADIDLMHSAACRAFNYVPYILHLNFLHDVGLFRAHPELAGKGDGALAGRYFAHKQGNQHRVPCASQPKLVEILTEWMESIAVQGAHEISCWLSERPAQWRLPVVHRGRSVRTRSASVHRSVAEGPRAVPGAADPAVSFDDDVGARPSGGGGGATGRQDRESCAGWLERFSHQPRDLFANPLLDRSAAEGRWVASYDVPIGAFGRVDTPEYKLPERSAHRIRDYVEQLMARRYSGAYGMLAWQAFAREICGFNIAALAEWSWNGGGRDEEAFATAWASRNGYDDPERPILGEGMFRYYESAADFERKKAVCVEALALVSDEACADLARETDVVRSYVGLAESVYRVADLVSGADLSAASVQAHFLEAVMGLEQAGAENTAAIRMWRAGLGPKPWHARVHDAVQGTEHTVAEIARIVRERHIP